MSGNIATTKPLRKGSAAGDQRSSVRWASIQHEETRFAGSTGFGRRLNLQHRFGRPVTLDALIDHYVEQELPQLRYGTQQAHLSSLKRWIRPRWGRCFLDQVKAMEVEQWLRSLPLAPKSKVNLRSLLHLLFQHGRRWEITDVNPIDLVR